MKFSRLALVMIFASAAWSQITDTGSPQAPAAPTIMGRSDMGVTNLGQGGEAARNYVNFFGLARAFIDSAYSQGSSATGGFDVGGGLDLFHGFEHGQLSLNYSGAYRDYTGTNYNSSFYQSLSLGFNYHLNKRWLVALREHVNILPQGFVPGSAEAGSLGSLGYNSGATKQQFYVTSATLVYQQSARWSYEFGGDYFYSSYEPTTLYNSQGLGAMATANYRLSGRETLTAGYQFSNFNFSAGAGHSNTNTGYLGYAKQVSRTLEFGIFGGASRTDYKQHLLSSAGTFEDVQGVSYSPFFRAKLVQYHHRYTGTVFLFNGINAGNGAYATSQAFDAGAGIGYTVSRNLDLSGQFGYQHFNQVAHVIVGSQGVTSYVFLTGGVNYRLGGHVALNFTSTYFGGTSSYVATTFGILVTSQNRPLSHLPVSRF